jgi:tetratricopeptide (TPR) repeat protein
VSRDDERASGAMTGMTARPTPARRAASRPRRRLVTFVAAICVVLAGVGIFLWLVVFKSDESNTDKATKAINAGLALQAKGDLAGAYAKYTEALKDDSNNKFALYDLAFIDYQQSNTGLAEQRYRQALAIDPNFEPALYNLAIVEQTLGKTRYALSLYQKAVQVNPADANAHFNLALMLRAMGYTKAGNAQMRIARQLNPKLKDPGGVATSSPSPAPGTSPSG